MQSLELVFPRQAPRIFTPMWPWGKSGPSSLAGTSSSPTLLVWTVIILFSDCIEDLCSQPPFPRLFLNPRHIQCGSGLERHVWRTDRAAHRALLQTVHVYECPGYIGRVPRHVCRAYYNHTNRWVFVSPSLQYECFWFAVDANIFLPYFLRLPFIGLLAFGVKESAMVNKIFTCVNILVLFFMVVSGLVKGTIKNWQIEPEEIYANYTTNSSHK